MLRRRSPPVEAKTLCRSCWLAPRQGKKPLRRWLMQTNWLSDAAHMVTGALKLQAWGASACAVWHTCSGRGLRIRRLGDAEDHDAKPNGGLVVVLHECSSVGG